MGVPHCLGICVYIYAYILLKYGHMPRYAHHVVAIVQEPNRFPSDPLCCA